MGFNISFGKSTGDPTGDKYVTWILTPSGRKYVNDYSGVPSVGFTVLSNLELLGGASTVETISKVAKLRQDIVDYQLKQASRANFCRRGMKTGEEANFNQGGE